MVTSYKGITCEANARNESYSVTITSRQTPKVVFIVGIMTCILAIFVTSVDSTISTSSRGRAADMAALRIPSSRKSLPRRPVFDQDYLEFRKFLHRLNQQRQGAKVYSRGDVRRGIIQERSGKENSIAKDLECGQCKLKKKWVPVSKPGCRTNYVLAPVCTGLCDTWEIPDIHPPYVTRKHRVCRPTQIEYRKINLQRCNPGVNSQYVIAMAKSCACMRCKGTNTDCRPL